MGIEKSFLENQPKSEEQRSKEIQEEVRAERNDTIVDIQQNEMKREELTKQYNRIQEQINNYSPANSTASVEELVKMREDVDGQILRLNEEERKLKAKLNPY